MMDRPPPGLFGRHPMALPDEARLLILRAYMLGQIDGIRQHMVHLGDLIAYADAPPAASSADLTREREEER